MILDERVTFENKKLNDRVLSMEERNEVNQKIFDNMQTHTRQV